jgi:CRISPR system Cascade subunit CasD
MSRSVLLLRLEGVWQSWGERSRWDVRDTGTEPTKSGIIGLLGCALGYPMRDPRLETELDAELRFGVRVEHPGRVVQDFQTVTDFLPTADGGYRYRGSTASVKSLDKLKAVWDATPYTIVSPRYYLEDASFLVALEGPEELLEKCATALAKPKWPIFLGRKACVPTRPIYDPAEQAKYPCIEVALARHGWSQLSACKELRKNSPEACRVFIEEPEQMSLPEMRFIKQIIRQDAMRINQARQYGFRNMREYVVQMPKEVTPHVPIED